MNSPFDKNGARTLLFARVESQTAKTRSESPTHSGGT